LVLADEQVPESWNGAPRTEELRELIASTEFSLNRKFQDLVTCKGALRIILCANNLKLISSREEFTPEDAQALADRFLFVVPDPAARDWLQARGGFRFTSSWVEGDRIARHALWLKAQAENHTRPIKPGARFIVPGDANELLAQMRAGSGLRWSILYWIDSFLRDPKVHFQARGGRSSAVLVKDREIWVAPRLLLDGWTHYLLGEKAPTQERLASAMRGLLVPAREARYQPNDGRKDGARYQKLDLAQLLAWYEMTHAELEELASFLEHDTETVFGGPRATVQAN
jgi:hypothetical protein